MSYGDMNYLHDMIKAILTNGTASLVIGISSDTYNLRKKLILKIEYLNVIFKMIDYLCHLCQQRFCSLGAYFDVYFFILFNTKTLSLAPV